MLLFRKPQRSASKDIREEDPKKSKIVHELVDLIEKLLVIKTNISKLKSPQFGSSHLLMPESRFWQGLNVSFGELIIGSKLISHISK